jgi:hypothetical protein
MRTLTFRDSTVIFATNHNKASVAKEPFARVLNATVKELAIDSDRLGTFSGEVERSGSMLDALRGKIQLAREVTQERFVLVSEGGFGQAGGLAFVAQGTEMLMLHDSVTGVEVVEQYVSWDTNYATASLKNTDELRRFLPRIDFGSHALVLYPEGLSPIQLVCKGITTLHEAEEAFTDSLAASPASVVLAMSDMRAHVNPTRMKAIQACCELLVQRLATGCPKCGSGGFGPVATVPGLPCAGCGAPTERAKAEKHACVVCKANIQKPRSDGRTTADPGECQWCNP